MEKSISFSSLDKCIEDLRIVLEGMKENCEVLEKRFKTALGEINTPTVVSKSKLFRTRMVEAFVEGMKNAKNMIENLILPHMKKVLFQFRDNMKNAKVTKREKAFNELYSLYCEIIFSFEKICLEHQRTTKEDIKRRLSVSLGAEKVDERMIRNCMLFPEKIQDVVMGNPIHGSFISGAHSLDKFITNFDRFKTSEKANKVDFNQIRLIEFNEKYRNDETVALSALHNGSDVLKYCGEKLRDHKGVVLLSVSKHPESVIYASERLKDDKDVMKEAISRNNHLAVLIGDTLKQDKELILSSLVPYDTQGTNEGDMLCNVGYWICHEKLRNDPDIFEKMMLCSLSDTRKNRDSHWEISVGDELAKDKEGMTRILKSIVKKIKKPSNSKDEDKEMESGKGSESALNLLLSIVPKVLINFGEDKEFASFLVSMTFQVEKSFAPLILPLLSRKLRDDVDIARQFVDVDGSLIRHFSRRIRADTVISKIAVESAAESFFFLDWEARRNDTIIRATLRKDGMMLRAMGDNIRDSYEHVKIAVTSNSKAVIYGSSRLQKDTRFSAEVEKWKDELCFIETDVTKALSNARNTDLFNCSDALRNDKSFMLKYIDKHQSGYVSVSVESDRVEYGGDHGYFMKYASEEIQNDSDVLIKAMVKRPECILYASRERRLDMKSYKCLSDETLKSSFSDLVDYELYTSHPKQVFEMLKKSEDYSSVFCLWESQEFEEFLTEIILQESLVGFLAFVSKEKRNSEEYMEPILQKLLEKEKRNEETNQYDGDIQDSIQEWYLFCGEKIRSQKKYAKYATYTITNLVPFLSGEIRKDVEAMKIFLTTGNQYFLRSAPCFFLFTDEMRNNEELIQIALKVESWNDSIYNVNRDYTELSVYWMGSDMLRDKKSVMYEALKYEEKIFIELPFSLKKNEDFIKELAMVNWEVSKYFSSGFEYHKNKEIAKLYMQQDPEAVENFHESVTEDTQVCKIAIEGYTRKLCDLQKNEPLARFPGIGIRIRQERELYIRLGIFNCHIRDFENSFKNWVYAMAISILYSQQIQSKYSTLYKEKEKYSLYDSEDGRNEKIVETFLCMVGNDLTISEIGELFNYDSTTERCTEIVEGCISDMFDNLTKENPLPKLSKDEYDELIDSEFLYLKKDGSDVGPIEWKEFKKAYIDGAIDFETKVFGWEIADFERIGTRPKLLSGLYYGVPTSELPLEKLKDLKFNKTIAENNEEVPNTSSPFVPAWILEFTGNEEHWKKLVHVLRDPLRYLSPESVTSFKIRERNVVQALMGFKPEMYEQIAEELKSDLKILEVAVSKDSRVFNQSSKLLQEDRDVVLCCVQKNPQVYRYISKEFQMDDEIVIAALSKNKKSSNLIFRFIPPTVIKNRDIVKAVLFRQPELFEKFCERDEDLEMDEEFIKKLVVQQPRLFQSIPKEFRTNVEFVKYVVDKNERVVEHIQKAEGIDDLEILLKLVKKNPKFFSTCSEKIRLHRPSVIKFVKVCGRVLEFASSFHEDLEIVLIAIRNDYEAFQFVSKNLKRNKAVVMEVLSQTHEARKFFINDGEVLEDEDVKRSIILGLSKDIDKCLEAMNDFPKLVKKENQKNQVKKNERNDAEFERNGEFEDWKVVDFMKSAEESLTSKDAWKKDQGSIVSRLEDLYEERCEQFFDLKLYKKAYYEMWMFLRMEGRLINKRYFKTEVSDGLLVKTLTRYVEYVVIQEILDSEEVLNFFSSKELSEKEILEKLNSVKIQVRKEITDASFFRRDEFNQPMRFRKPLSVQVLKSPGTFQRFKEMGIKVVDDIVEFGFFPQIGYCGVRKKKENKDWKRVKQLKDQFSKEGFGYEFVSKRAFFSSSYKLVFVGNFTNGVRQGEGREYDDKKADIIFHGMFRNGKRDGKGREFEKSRFIVYEGMYKGGRRHGRGEMFDNKLQAFVRGRWDKGSLKSRISSFKCPIVQFRSLEKHLMSSNIIGKGAYGIIFKVSSSVIYSLLSSPMINQTSKPKFLAVKIFNDEGVALVRELIFRQIKNSVELFENIEDKTKNG